MLNIIKEKEEQKAKINEEIMHYQFLVWRGISLEDACSDCGGSGVKTYADASTWHNEEAQIAAQVVTKDICDVCWGSGNKNKPWLNLKDVRLCNCNS